MRGKLRFGEKPRGQGGKRKRRQRVPPPEHSYQRIEANPESLSSSHVIPEPIDPSQTFVETIHTSQSFAVPTHPDHLPPDTRVLTTPISGNSGESYKHSELPKPYTPATPAPTNLKFTKNKSGSYLNQSETKGTSKRRQPTTLPDSSQQNVETPPEITRPSPVTHDSTPQAESPGTPTGADAPKPAPSKLKFDKSETGPTSIPASETPSESPCPKNKKKRRIAKLEAKADGYEAKLEKARSKIPTKKVVDGKPVGDNEIGKGKQKLQFDTEPVPIGEATWNQPQRKPITSRAISSAIGMGATKIHRKIHQVEGQNVGVEAAHKAELMGESAYKGVKSAGRSARLYYKNRHYRRASKLETKSLKTRMKLDYARVKHEYPGFLSRKGRLKHGSSTQAPQAGNSKPKKKPLSRFFQKRAIKQKYAVAIKNAKASGKTGKLTLGITQKASKIITGLVRKNPILLLKIGLLVAVIFLIMSVITMCGVMISNTASVITVSSFLADDEAIDNAALAYSEWEMQLRLQIENVHDDFPGFDEYRFVIGDIRHCPLALMAYLTAVYQEFTYPEIRTALQDLFNAQYQLSFVESTENRQIENDYGELVTIQWRILTVILHSRPFNDVINERMTSEQREHHEILMYTAGARQIVGSPFDFNWLPFVTSQYGWRIHPISGNPQMHRGIDIGLPTGMPILAAHDGTITFAGEMGGYGLVIFIVSDGGIETRYAHCDTILVTVGQIVSMGDVIGTVGSTGDSTGPHLHFEILVNGSYRNPLFFAMHSPF